MSQNYSKLIKITFFLVWIITSFIVAELILSIISVLLENIFNFSLDSLNSVLVNTVYASILYLLTLVIAIISPLYWKKKINTNIKDIGLDRLPSWGDILITPVSIVGYFLFSACLLIIFTNIFPWIDANQVQDIGFDNLSQRYEYLLAFFTLVIIAPLAEETLFRGYLFGKIKKYAPVWVAILITSMVFGSVHYGGWNLVIDTFALSVVLCIVREMTGSIWASVLLHMSKNAIAYFMLFINPLF